MKRTNYSSGAKWEDIVGYSRAVKVGNIIEVTGTVAADDNSMLVGGNSAYEQTKFIIQKIEKALNDLGGSLQDVIRTRIYVTNIRDWDAVGRAHGEFFKEIKPATTMVEVKSLIDPNFVVELEATAYLQEE